MRSDRTDHTDELARYLVKKERVPAKLTGSTTSGGNSQQTAIWTLPKAIGDPGDVLTVVTNGDGDDVPSWEVPASVASGQYRQYVVVSDGAGGFDFIDDGFGSPVYTLESLE